MLGELKFGGWGGGLMRGGRKAGEEGAVDERKLGGDDA